MDSVLVTVVLYEFQSVFRVCSRGGWCERDYCGADCEEDRGVVRGEVIT